MFGVGRRLCTPVCLIGSSPIVQAGYFSFVIYSWVCPSYLDSLVGIGGESDAGFLAELVFGLLSFIDPFVILSLACIQWRY